MKPKKDKKQNGITFPEDKIEDEDSEATLTCLLHAHTQMLTYVQSPTQTHMHIYTHSYMCIHHIYICAYVFTIIFVIYINLCFSLPLLEL